MKALKEKLSDEESTYIWSELESSLKEKVLDAFRKAYKRRTSRHVLRTLDINDPKIIISADYSNCRFSSDDVEIMDLLLTKLA